MIISSIIWMRKKDISVKSNYIQALKWRKNTYKVYKWMFQVVIAKNVSITCISISSIYVVALFTCLFLLRLNVHKKQAFKCLFKIPLWRESITPFFYFVILLVTIWSENSISMPKHHQIIYFWIWLFGGAVYLGVEEAEAGRGHWWTIW